MGQRVRIYNANNYKHTENTMYVLPLHKGLQKTIWECCDDFYIFSDRRVKYCNSKKQMDEIGIIEVYCEKNDLYLKRFIYSIGKDVDYYKKIVKAIPNYEAYLAELNDIIWLKYINNKSIDIPEHELEHIDSMRKIDNILKIFDKRNSALSYLYYDNKDLDINIAFDFHKDDLFERNINVLIGRNGVGKTYLMQKMILSLISNTNEKRGRFNLNEFPLKQIVDVYFSSFDNTIRNVMNPRIPISFIDYKVNSSSLNIDSVEQKKFLDSSIFESIFSSKSKIKLLSIINGFNDFRKEIIIKVIQVLYKDENFGFKDLFEGLDKNPKQLIMATFSNLSNGHKKMIYTLVTLINELEPRSLVFMDEPEANLYPGLISLYLKAIDLVLSSFSSKAIIFTHSPVLVQQVPRECIHKIRRIDGNMYVGEVDYDTFAGNIGTVTKKLFDVNIEDSLYIDTLRTITANNEINKYFDKLGLEAQSILRILERNKND